MKKIVELYFYLRFEKKYIVHLKILSYMDTMLGKNESDIDSLRQRYKNVFLKLAVIR